MAQKLDTDPTVEELLKEFERKLDRLRFQYEQYFLGIDKLEPTQLKKDVFRLQHALSQENLSTAGARFRFRSLSQRYSSYKSYWTRTLRQIELGTHPRTIARLEREMRKKGMKVESLRGVRNPAQLEAAVLRAASGTKSAPAAAQARPAPASAKPAGVPAPGGMSDREAADLHRSYVEARRQCGQSSAVDYSSFMSTLRQRADSIRAKYGVSEIRFKVAVREGKPILQAIPKK